jgi:hypothetical protein
MRVSTPAGIAADPLVVAVAGITLALLVLAILLVAADRRLLAAAQHQADTLRISNTELGATQREIVRRLALTAGCDTSLTEGLLMAAPLHDIGKIGIADAILLKPGKLDPHEREEMQKHAEIGHKILDGSRVKLLELAAERVTENDSGRVFDIGCGHGTLLARLATVPAFRDGSGWRYSPVEYEEKIDEVLRLARRPAFSRVARGNFPLGLPRNRT